MLPWTLKQQYESPSSASARLKIPQNPDTQTEHLSGMGCPQAHPAIWTFPPESHYSRQTYRRPNVVSENQADLVKSQRGLRRNFTASSLEWPLSSLAWWYCSDTFPCHFPSLPISFLSLFWKWNCGVSGTGRRRSLKSLLERMQLIKGGHLQ